MGWKERYKCRQSLKCMSVFLLRPCSVKGARRNWLGAWAAGEAWPPLCTPNQGTGQLSSPSPRASGTSLGLGMGQGWMGHYGCGELEAVTPTVCASLSSLTLVSENLMGAALSQYLGILPGLFVKPSLPKRCSPTGLGWCYLLGCPWGVSLNSVPVPLACDTVQKCLSQCVMMRGISPGPPSLLGAWILVCPSKGQDRQPSQGQEMSKHLPGPFLPLLFWDLRARCCCPDLCFHAIVYLGYT